MDNKLCDQPNQICATILRQLTEGIQELKELSVAIDKKVDLSVQKLEFELQQVKRTDDEQNRILAEHIKGVNTLRELYENHKAETHKRLEKLEEKEKFWKYIKSGILFIGSVVAMFWAILQIIHLLKG